MTAAVVVEIPDRDPDQVVEREYSSDEHTGGLRLTKTAYPEIRRIYPDLKNASFTVKPAKTEKDDVTKAMVLISFNHKGIKFLCVSSLQPPKPPDRIYSIEIYRLNTQEYPGPG